MALAAVFIHNDMTLIIGTIDGTVLLWDVGDAYIFSMLEHQHQVISLCLNLTAILLSVSVICSLVAHYILEKDVSLIATGIVYPPSEAGIYIWQTIGNIKEDKPLNQPSLLAATKNNWTPAVLLKLPASGHCYQLNCCSTADVEVFLVINVPFLLFELLSSRKS